MSAKRNRTTRRNWIRGNDKVLSILLGELYLSGGSLLSTELVRILHDLNIDTKNPDGMACTFMKRLIQHEILEQVVLPTRLGYRYTVGKRGKAFFEGQLFTGERKE